MSLFRATLGTVTPDLSHNRKLSDYLLSLGAWRTDYNVFGRVLEEQRKSLEQMTTWLSAWSNLNLAYIPETSYTLATTALELVSRYNAYSDESLSALIREASGEAGQQGAMPLPDTARDVLYPSIATRRHLEAVSDVLVLGGAEASAVPSLEWEPGSSRAKAGGYDEVWEIFGARFDRMWKGAWQILDSGSEDATRQAADSGRELLSQILREMAPEDRFTPEEIEAHGYGGQPTSVMRVKYVVKAGLGSNSSDEWAQAGVKALDLTFDLMTRQSHGTEDIPGFRPGHVAAELDSLGASLRFLSDCYRSIAA